MTLLISTASFQVQQLQLIQNAATRIVTQKRKFYNSTPILKDLHWLPVEARIKFKTDIVIQVFKCLNGTAPENLSSLMELNSCPREGMRSANDILRLNVPSSKLQKFGDRAFSVAGPRVWNDLPQHIRESSSVSFKRTLLTISIVYIPPKILLHSFLACQERIEPMECIAHYKKTLLLYSYYYCSRQIQY